MGAGVTAGAGPSVLLAVRREEPTLIRDAGHGRHARIAGQLIRSGQFVILIDVQRRPGGICAMPWLQTTTLLTRLAIPAATVTGVVCVAKIQGKERRPLAVG